MRRLCFMVIVLQVLSVALLSAQTSVTDLVLINADNNTEVRTLTSGAVIDLTEIPKINIRAITDPDLVGSVVFRINGKSYRTENIAPYALGGDFPPGTYAAYPASVGTFTVCAIPYSGSNASGVQGTERCVELTFIKSDAAPVIGVPDHEDLNFWGEMIAIQVLATDPQGKSVTFSAEGLPPSLEIDPSSGLISGVLDLVNTYGSSTGFDALITATNSDGLSSNAPIDFFILHPNIESFTLINTETNLPVPGYDPIPYGGTIDLSETGGQLNIRANPAIPVIYGGSVLFELNGAFVRAENIAPYALGGDAPPGHYYNFPLVPGNYNLAARIVSGVNGSGGFSFYGNTNLPFSVIDGVSSTSLAKVYPNPASEYIEISDLQNVRSFAIIDQFRQTEFSQPVNTDLQRIDISNLPSGLYILRLQYDNTVKNLKLIKR
ncbi:T9SS type A sorting domain-containing protein [Robertkochia solimangrovi]|uniref:T9SS type A sorting domain-containing protein n=1 Tax=Robertkochia solimangrovi TaxID=2213046 RepID=UPI00117D1A7C|nr:T9SS type A sorting domain-containing protein [Robertkochia solimangrovi]TRZ41187.1 hypothetical protein DMZ48_18105 [Robertkochia solimangrovi]